MIRMPGHSFRAKVTIASGRISVISSLAALLEVRGHLLVAEGDTERADTLLAEAANLFAASGQPLDAQRCRTQRLEAGARTG